MDQNNFSAYFPEYYENIRIFHYSNYVKSNYELGIWLFEPDEIVWHNTRDCYMGIIERLPEQGYLRGMLGLPYYIDEDDLADLDTYRPLRKVTRELFYFPREDESEVVSWIEFSCNGPHDYCPGSGQCLLAHPNKHYRDIYFVSNEIKLIGLQLKELAHEHQFVRR